MDIVGRAWEFQRKVEERAKRLGRGKYGRVMKMARKPTPDEYTKTVQITGLGALLLGALGFLIFFLMTEVPKHLEGILP